MVNKIHMKNKVLSIHTKDEVIISWISNIVLALVAIMCLYPFLNVVARSFSDEAAVLSGSVGIIPKGFNTNAYKVILGSSRFVQSFKVSVFITVVGTILNVALTAFVAYASSRKDLPGKNLISFLYIFTMLFGGGMIPTYLVVVASGLQNTLWSLIIPGLVAPFNLILMRSYFSTIPESLEESAKLDGADQITILFRIILPLALPSLATIALFCAVGYWNEYFNALIYIDDRSLVPIQIYLREILINAKDADLSNVIEDLLMNTPEESVRGATVFAATIPVLCIYPFLQKYYVQGMTLGAVKA